MSAEAEHRARSGALGGGAGGGRGEASSARDEASNVRGGALGSRAEAFAARLEATARRAGIDETGTARILEAYRTAMVPRERLLESDHHPDYLRPGRTALILLEDVGLRDPLKIAAGTLLESRRADLVATSGDDEVRALVEAVPTPDRAGELLLEELLLATEPIRALALAERLDQLRHLHLYDEECWRPMHQQATEIYLPLAPRTHPTLARRYRWWCRVFEERYLTPLPPAGEGCNFQGASQHNVPRTRPAEVPECRT